MKTFFLLSLFITCFLSCKKKEATTCEITMTEIAGHYKFTKLEKVSYGTGEAQDITSTLTSCELSGTYTFNIDSTATYSESGNCNGSGTGTWDLPGTWMYTAFTLGNGNRINATFIESWDCSNLVLITRYPSVNYNFRTTLTRFQY
jgi:hypothetical protein